MTVYRLPVTGAFPYFKKGTASTPLEQKLQAIVYAIKNGEDIRLSGVSTRSDQAFVQLYQPEARDRRFLNRERTLVPMPLSTATPSPPEIERWPGFGIAEGLVNRGLACDARPLVRRSTAVESSRVARSAGRKPPTVEEHVASLDVDIAALRGVTAITVIDDVVSSGSNTMGAAVALRRAGFHGDIAVFTAAYLSGGAPGNEAHYGRIVWTEGRPSSFRRSEVEENPRWQPSLAGEWTPDPPTHDEWDF